MSPKSIFSTESDIAAIERHNRTIEQKIRRFASGHYLSNLAYVLAKLGEERPESVRVLNENGTLKEHYIYPMPLKEGLYAYILIPKNKDCHPKITFRGTNFAEFSSAIINLESFGPGTVSFTEAEDFIFTYLNNILKAHYGKTLPPLKLQVCGHSQGASMAQLFCAALLMRRANSNEWDNLYALHMAALNSPGIPFTTAQEAEEALIEQQPHKPIQVVANYGMVGGDPVQMTGWTTLFARLPDFRVEVNLLKADKGLEGYWFKDFDYTDGVHLTEFLSLPLNAIKGLLGAHPNNTFFATKENGGKINVTGKYHFYTNKAAKDIPLLQKELLNKATFLQLAFFIPREILYYALDIFNTEVKKPLGMIWEFKEMFNDYYHTLLHWYKGVSPVGEALYINEQKILASKKNDVSLYPAAITENGSQAYLPRYDTTEIPQESKNVLDHSPHYRKDKP